VRRAAELHERDVLGDLTGRDLSAHGSTMTEI
jgi:hypothetical protein